VTIIESRRVRPELSGRPEIERVIDQVSAIGAWNRARREVEARAAEAGSREMRLDRARRLDVVRRQHGALVESTERQLRDAGGCLEAAPAPRAVVVHRNDWFKDKLGAGLRAGGFTVVGELSNGADAVGVVVAEQPDVLLVEDKLPMLGGLAVVAEVRRYAPKTLVTVQVGNDWEIGPFLDAGAHAAFTRRIPPADIAEALCELLAS
jgi:CheY-like chemotaxis protein